MPAVTVDDILVLPRMPPSPTATAQPTAPVASVTTAPQRLRGRGLPGPPRVRRRRPAPTSTRSSTWTRWARSTTRRASPRAPPWHPHRGFETVTYMIDGDLRAPGLQRRRRR